MAENSNSRGSERSSALSFESDWLDEEVKERRLLVRERVRLIWSEFRSNLIAATSLKNVANFVFIFGVSAICLQQTFSQINEYFKFGTRLQVTHSFPSSTLWLIPGVTVCSNNQVRMDRLAELSDELKQKLKVFTNFTDPSQMEMLTESRSNAIKKQIKQFVDETINLSSLIAESPISELMDLSRGSMIKDINCNNLWGRPINCENIRIVESYQAGHCYTIFYLGAILEALASGKAFDFNTSLLLDGRRKIDTFDDHEIAEIVIDFEPMEHAEPHTDAGGKLVVHSTGHVGSVRDMAFSLEPGFRYELIIKRDLIKRLPPPYRSMCFDYRRENSHHFIGKLGSPPSVELDRTTCLRNCVLRESLKSCKCWPVEIPFYLSDTSIDDKVDSYAMCPWGYDGIEQNYSANLYRNCFKKFDEPCRASCRQGCRTEDYRIRLMSTPWPTKSMIASARDGQSKQVLQRFRRCCSRVSIKYLDFMEDRHVMIPGMTLAQLVSNIGGIVSALIGVSVVTIYRYLTRQVFRCQVVRDYMPTSAGAACRAAAARNKLMETGLKLRAGATIYRGVTRAPFKPQPPR